VQLTDRNLLVRALAEIDQRIAAVEDPSLEPGNSDQVQRAVALLIRLCESRSEMEGLTKCRRR
jgi:hypothetical protein